MTNRANRKVALLPVALAFVATSFGLESKEWKFRQSVPVERSGVIKLTLPPATLDATRPQLEDLRLLDPSGREISYLIQQASGATSAAMRAPELFRVTLGATQTQLLIQTGTTTPLVGVTLLTPAPTFLKAARVEVANGTDEWTEITSGAPLFRQFGAEQLTIDLGKRVADRLRITIDDSRSRAIPFTAATLQLAVSTQAAASLPVPTAQLTHREEFAGETVLTVDLGAQHLRLGTLELNVGDPLFMRKVSVTTSEVHDDTVVERSLAAGSIYRLTIDGVVPTAHLDVPLTFTAPRRELQVHVMNGDSPPLTVDSITVSQRPVWLIFSATAPGIYTLLAGNPDAAAPRYDLSSMPSLQSTAASDIGVGAVEENIGYQRRVPLANTPLVGGPLDPTPWHYRKIIECDGSGVQQLELDLDVLTGSANNLADLRLVRDGAQIPYILERTSHSRSIALLFTGANDAKRPPISRWQLILPRPRAPITQITLHSSTALFQREIRLFETVSDEARGNFERNFAVGDWHKLPDRDQTLTLTLGAVPAGDNLLIETNNSDNPAIALTKVDASFPVVRLLFKANAGRMMLHYGNPEVAAPRYDVALIADQLVAAEKNVAALGPEEAVVAPKRSSFIGDRAGLIFWGALSLVVITLLVVVARLLPKPPGAA